MNNKDKAVDIRGGIGNAGDILAMMPLQIGRMSQKWYFDQNGYVRSVINGYAISKIGKKLSLS
jgi:hypothetical protein